MAAAASAQPQQCRHPGRCGRAGCASMDGARPAAGGRGKGGWVCAQCSPHRGAHNRHGSDAPPCHCGWESEGTEYPGELVAEGRDGSSAHPLHHAIMVAIDASARENLQIWPSAAAPASQDASMSPILEATSRCAHGAVHSSLSGEGNGMAKASQKHDREMGDANRADLNGEHPGVVQAGAEHEKRRRQPSWSSNQY